MASMAVSGGAGLLEDFVDTGDGLDGGDGALELGGAGDVEGDGDVGDVVDVVAGDVVHVEALLLGDAVNDVAQQVVAVDAAYAQGGAV